MNEQWSYSVQNDVPVGKLYLVATPIGNLDDITFRAVQLLREAYCVAAEDTRHSRKLLSHFEIHVPELIAYHEHNKMTAGPRIIDMLRAGKQVVLVSDAGTPAIADPGYELVLLAIEAGIPVIPIPGANAALSALIASGQVTQPFAFIGFLPRDNKPAKLLLEKCRKWHELTLIFYEAPHRIRATIQRFRDTFDHRPVSVARELTKRHEHFLRGTLEELQQYFEANEPRGEFVIVLGPSTVSENGPERSVEDDENWWKPLNLRAHVDHYVQQGQPEKEAMRMVAKDRGLRKRDVYQSLMGSDE